MVDTPTTRKNSYLFPNTFYTAPLETWAAIIQGLSSEAEQCFLEQVVHYKALFNMEHEFIVVYASHPSGSKIVLGVDRNAQVLATAASKRTSGSAPQDTDKTKPSTVASLSARYLNIPVWAKSLPPSSSSSSSSSEEELSHLAYDSVQVSHDGTPAPILAQHGLCVLLYTITFSSTSTSTTSSNSDARCPPSLLHLSVLLLTIHTHFPSYDLLQYQCYFFARATRLALKDLFSGVQTDLEGGKRAATWRGVHVSLYSVGRTVLGSSVAVGFRAVGDMLLSPVVVVPAPIKYASVLAAYSAMMLCEWYVVGNGADRRRISDKNIRQSYRAAWRSFVLERRGR
ncbi:hypothetical protein F5888DRAFT_203166 [Russula emetica]|nr:hypothetical protein F5888DRAFT_203166 [Russula emetica]